MAGKTKPDSSIPKPAENGHQQPTSNSEQMGDAVAWIVKPDSRCTKQMSLPWRIRLNQEKNHFRSRTDAMPVMASLSAKAILQPSFPVAKATKPLPNRRRQSLDVFLAFRIEQNQLQSESLADSSEADVRWTKSADFLQCKWLFSYQMDWHSVQQKGSL